MDFAVPADHRVKLKESEKKDKYLNIARELKKLWNIKVTVIPILIDALGPVTRVLVPGPEDLEIRERVETIVGNRKTSRDHPNYRIIKIGLNTEKSPGDLRRLAVTQTPVRKHRLTLV